MTDEMFDKLIKKQELKPCPFCGATESIDIFSKIIGFWAVGCFYDECHVNPCTEWIDSKKKAIEKWNKRVETK